MPGEPVYPVLAVCSSVPSSAQAAAAENSWGNPEITLPQEATTSLTDDSVRITNSEDASREQEQQPQQPQNQQEHHQHQHHHHHQQQEQQQRQFEPASPITVLPTALAGEVATPAAESIIDDEKNGNSAASVTGFLLRWDTPEQLQLEPPTSTSNAAEITREETVDGIPTGKEGSGPGEDCGKTGEGGGSSGNRPLSGGGGSNSRFGWGEVRGKRKTVSYIFFILFYFIPIFLVIEEKSTVL